jgi:hypothetical protein
VAKWFWVEGRWKNKIPPASELDKTVPVLPLDRAKVDAPPAGEIQCTWIGHATVLVCVPLSTALTNIQNS